MNVKYVNPFIEATRNVFREFVGLYVKANKPFIYIPNTETIKYDISGIIGLAGEVLGMVVISFPKAIALKTVSHITNTEALMFDEVAIDSIGELINIIAGNSKKALEEVKIVISLPSIVKGYNHQFAWMSGVPVICIPFDLESGEFYIFVSLKNLII